MTLAVILASHHAKAAMRGLAHQLGTWTEQLHSCRVASGAVKPVQQLQPGECWRASD